MVYLFDADVKGDIASKVSRDALPYFKQIKDDLQDPGYKATFYNTLLQINARRNNRSFEEIHLTERELEIVELMLKGIKYREISSRFNVSLDAIFTHVRSVYKKLEVCSRTEMASKILYCNAAMLILILNFSWS